MNLNPRVRPTPAAELREGDVVLESPEHPARIYRLTVHNGRVAIWCRYIWQPKSDPAWQLGSFRPEARMAKAVR